MQLKTLVTSIAVALVASANAAVISERAALIASDPCECPLLLDSALLETDIKLPDYACNCPNNCDYTAGHSCKYYAGPSDTSDIIDGSRLRHYLSLISVHAHLF